MKMNNDKKIAVFIFLFVQFLCNPIQSIEINKNGYWVGDVTSNHITDLNLAKGIGIFLQIEGAEKIVDLGCGMGEYARYFQSIGLSCEAYDGNPLTPQLTNGLGKVQDFSQPFYLGYGFDWVVSLEVGEHLPPKFETIFIENLMRHSTKGIILSWAIKNQGGDGHFNEQNNDYIKSVFKKYGYVNDVEAENTLREEAVIPWFKNTIMVFRK